MKFAKFFQDRRGHWAVVQPPNLLLCVWFVLMIANLFIRSQPVKLLQSAVLFSWAYQEVTDSDSYFRRTLGAVILVAVILSYFGI